MHDFGTRKKIMNPTSNTVKVTIYILVTFISYYFLSYLNINVMTFARYAEGISWIYLPSGVVLVSILLFEESGALGIALASTLITLHFYQSDDLITVIGNGFITGFSPLAARYLFLSILNVDTNLNNLSRSSLVKLAALFSVILAVTREIWYVSRGYSPSPDYGIAVSIVGNFLGTIFILYSVKLFIDFLYSVRNKNS